MSRNEGEGGGQWSVARNEGHMEECNQQLAATSPIGRARHKRSMLNVLSEATIR